MKLPMNLKGKTMFASLHTSTLAVSRVQSRGIFADVAKRLRLAATARHQRAQLARLDDQMLADIGLTPREAATEAARPAWDVPRNWLR
jgi:uncharacterized protein YjiS (DUF1127 family)